MRFNEAPALYRGMPHFVQSAKRAMICFNEAPALYRGMQLLDNY